MRRLALLLALAAISRGEETKDLEQPAASVKAKDLRGQAQTLWIQVQPLWEKIRTKAAVTPAEAAAAMPPLEQAIEVFERSLREEWNREANRTLGDAVRAWCKLRLLVPADASLTEAARKKVDLARKRDVREFVMKYAAERRATSLFRPCPSCDGRGESASPFGDRRDCAPCAKRGKLLDREGILDARWYRFSPLYRAMPRHEQEVNRLLRGTAPDAQRDHFAPYLRGVTIKEVTDHDFWASVKAQDQIQPTLTSNKTEKVEVTYVLFRVGPVWYLWDEQADRELLDLTEQKGMAAPTPPR
jgi:hypothetical protein